MTAPGTLVAGKYRVDRVLGQGGMGMVVQATHLQLVQPVAIKFLLPEVLANPQIVQRFLREAQAAVRLRSEHVARVIDVGTLETGAPYIVLEYLEGADLAKFPREQLTVGVIVDLMLQACEALAEAHAVGIIHRDIKPANLFVTRGTDHAPLLKILDFGISKAPALRDSNLTGTQVVMGTPAYMSPEQMRSARAVDHRSDIWSLGVVLYELLQGTPPFQADTFSSMVVKVVTEPLPPITARIPVRLADVVVRCLNKDAARRFQDVGELARALAPFARSAAQAKVSVERTGRVVGSIPGQASSGHAPSTLTEASGAIADPPRHRRRWPALAALAGIAVLAVVYLVAPSRRAVETGGAPAGEPSATPAAHPAPPPPAPAVPIAPPAPAAPVASPPAEPAPAVASPPAEPAPAVASPPAGSAQAPLRVEAPRSTPAPGSPSHAASPAPSGKAPANRPRPRQPASAPPLRGSAAGSDDILDTRH